MKKTNSNKKVGKKTPQQAQEPPKKGPYQSENVAQPLLKMGNTFCFPDPYQIGKQGEIETGPSAEKPSKGHLSVDEVWAKSQQELEQEKEKKLVDFLTKFVVRMTLEEYNQQKH